VKQIKIPKIVKDFSSFFTRRGYQLYLVGGAVRNHFLGLPEGDYDFATDAEPDVTTRIFRRVIPTGIDHGTVTVLFKGHRFEVTTFRTESEYSDFRHPDAVQFARSIEEDLSRRDFTVNALAVDVESGRLTDLFSGMNDLKNGIIRAVGNPQERFREDALRMLRACRFCAQLEFKLEDQTFTAISELHKLMRTISAERIRDELEKILASRKPSAGLLLLKNTGLLQEVLPEMLPCLGAEQKGSHRYDVFHHLVYSCDGAPPDRPAVRWAALLHDIGKPQTAEIDKESGVVMFIGHEKVSAEIADAVMQRLKFPVRRKNYIVQLIRNHMFNYSSEWSDAAVRRFIRRVGTDALDDLFSLRHADQYGTFGYFPKTDEGEFRNRIKSILEEKHATSLKDLSVNGYDLMKELELPGGRMIGVILNELLETVINDPNMNEKEKLLNLAGNLYRQYTGNTRQ